MTLSISDLRDTEFSRLDTTHQIYLDYTGGGLYSESQIRAHADMLAGNVLGNPHSRNPTSLASTHNVEAARERIHRFFKADDEEYEVVFTLNASGALKIVGESYPFRPGGRYALTADNHNSVNGIREFARDKGAEVVYLPLSAEMRAENVEALLAEGIDRGQPNLFAYPAQSNFSGVKHPLEWIAAAQALGYDVLLDAAAFAPSSPLDLSAVHPDFVSLSFYKMFGFPTGVGALIVRREAMRKLERPWFAGGTVRFVSAQNQEHLLALSGEAFEDGTLNYLSIAAVPAGLDFLDRVGMANVNAHVAVMTAELIDGISGLRHSNDAPMAVIYGPENGEGRGGTVAFNLLTPTGNTVDFNEVEERSIAHNISIRTGCFCNPGAAEFAFNYVKVEAYQCFHLLAPEEFTLQQFSACMQDRVIGAVRASVGLATNEADLRAFLAVLESFRDETPRRVFPRTPPEFVGP